jgi:hypothetical protein
MVSAVDDMLFTTCDSVLYHSFSDLHAVVDNLASTVERIKERRAELLCEESQPQHHHSEAAPAPVKSCQSISSSSSLGLPSPVDLPATKFNGYRPCSTETEDMHIYNMHFQYDIHHKQGSGSDGLYTDNVPSARALGTRDDSDGAYYESALDCESALAGLVTTGWDSSLVVDEDMYSGFSSAAPDVYTRTSNPHLQMNEIGVIRFNEMLRV